MAGGWGLYELKHAPGGAVPFNLGGSNHAWPHDAHLSPQHVPELGKFIEAGLAQSCADPGHAGIVLEFIPDFKFAPEYRVALQDLIRVHRHGAQLKRVKFAPRTNDATAVE